MKHNPRKRFGQNFLNDTHVIEAIVNAIHPLPEDNFLEIGPGLGALTLPLLSRLPKLVAIELDRDLFQYLSELPAGQNKLKLISADALTIDYSEFAKDLRIIGNLPYNISTPLLFHLLKFIPFIKDMHFMLQKEVVDRMAASPGSKTYGRLSIILQYQCKVESLFSVPPEAFDPPPKVNSAIVRLVPYQQCPFDEVPLNLLAQVVTTAFSMRRKTLINNLKKIISLVQLENLGIEGTKRPEEISIVEYVQIAKFLSK